MKLIIPGMISGNFHAVKFGNAETDRCKLSLREIKSENFHAVKLIGRDKKLHVRKSNLRSFVFLSAAATLNTSSKRKIVKESPR